MLVTPAAALVAIPIVIPVDHRDLVDRRCVLEWSPAA